MREYFKDLYGNRPTALRLGKNAESGTFSHAVILEGAPGSGKRTFARMIAAALFCENRQNARTPLPCGACRACHLVAENKAPDIKTVTRGDKATLGVDAVREMRTDMFLSSTEFDRKIYIVEDAHTMTAQAQNALLKVLEEPPTEILILLLCESADALLTTVRSRARLIRMQNFTPAELLRYFEENDPLSLAPYRGKEAAVTALLATANGSIGAAKKFLSPKMAADIEKERGGIKELLSALKSSDRFALLCDCFSRLPSKREPLATVLEDLLRALRDLAVYKKTKNAPLCFFAGEEELAPFAEGMSLAFLFYAYERTDETLRQIERNANISTALTLLKCDLGNPGK